ncbi:MAG: RimK family alpha-L-glutamate ligase [Clostridiaceae bacterium]|jgi:RimK family alpha-L-glutamate ligase|nr:RimK family alpha-L-glutamate ligase [Clostridiaceae bacterium]
MNGWIIYNGALGIQKIDKLVQRVCEEAAKMGINLEMVANNELIPEITPDGNFELKTLRRLREPMFIIFWDKDVLLARYLEMLGYRLFNRSEAIEACDNKALMHLKLNGLRVPKTIIGPFAFFSQSLTDKYFEKIIEELGEEVILKESCGSFGMQVYRLKGIKEIRDKISVIKNRHFIVQEVIKTSLGKDIRVNIIGDEIVGAMQRSNSTDFRANITLGGKGELVALSEEQREIALKAHKMLGLDFSGVDLLIGESCEPIICEVNSNVNFLSFEDLSGINFSNRILRYIMEKIK